jgi:hypothetical protein
VLLGNILFSTAPEGSLEPLGFSVLLTLLIAAATFASFYDVIMEILRMGNLVRSPTNPAMTVTSMPNFEAQEIETIWVDSIFKGKPAEQ